MSTCITTNENSFRAFSLMKDARDAEVPNKKIQPQEDYCEPQTYLWFTEAELTPDLS